VACSVCEYAVPTEPFGRGDKVVIWRVAAAPITMLKDCEVAERPPASVILIVMVDVPCVFGVPVTFTVFVVLDANVSPLGKEPDAIVHVNGATPPVSFTLPL